jgi:hypothetical protein
VVGAPQNESQIPSSTRRIAVAEELTVKQTSLGGKVGSMSRSGGGAGGREYHGKCPDGVGDVIRTKVGSAGKPKARRALMGPGRDDRRGGVSFRGERCLILREHNQIPPPEAGFPASFPDPVSRCRLVCDERVRDHVSCALADLADSGPGAEWPNPVVRSGTHGWPPYSCSTLFSPPAVISTPVTSTMLCRSPCW